MGQRSPHFLGAIRAAILCGSGSWRGSVGHTPGYVASALDGLSSRVRRMSPPLARHPERFHEERSDVAKAIAGLARLVCPRGRPASGVTVDVSDIRRGRIVSTVQTINGRRAVVQKRKAFAIFVGQ